MDPGSFSPVSINYFGTNLHKGLAKLVPAFYLEEDYNLSGSKITPVDALLSSHLSLAANISSVLPIAVGSLTGTIYSGLNTISGISNYFVIQNNLTYITQEKFEKNVLAKLNKTFADFATSSSYVNYLSSTFIPTNTIKPSPTPTSSTPSTPVPTPTNSPKPSISQSPTPIPTPSYSPRISTTIKPTPSSTPIP
jgi:hypothetical protein